MSAKETQMALTWGTLIAGAVLIFGLPLAIFVFNRRKRNAGWWLLFGVVAFMIVGNLIERGVTGYSAMLR